MLLFPWFIKGSERIRCDDVEIYQALPLPTPELLAREAAQQRDGEIEPCFELFASCKKASLKRGVRQR
jgi:hypothetical protein